MQHKDGKQLTPSPSEDHTHNRTESKLEYSVYILHNGHVIDGEVILTGPTTKTGYHIQFLLLGNFVVAFVPKVMLHIINVNVHTDPCHHVILKGDHAPSLPGNDMERVLTMALTDNRISSDVSSSVFDVDSQIFYSCRLESKGLLRIFKETDDTELKLSILHIVIVNTREYSIAIQMIEHVCQSPFSLDTFRLFQEFIVALSFANILSDSPAFLSRHLPLTTTLTYHGNIYKNRDGSKYVILRCSELPNFVKQLLVQSDQKFVIPSPDQLYDYTHTSTDALGHLCFNAVLSQPHIYKRLSLEELAAQVRLLALSTPSPVSKRSTMKKEKQSDTNKSTIGKSGNFMDKLKVLIQSPRLGNSQGSRDQSIPCLPFLLPDEDIESALRLRLYLLRDRLFQVMTCSLSLRSKYSTSSMVSKCEIYWKELQSSSRILLHIIWDSLKFSNENHPLQMPIHRQPAIEENILFQLLESFYTAHMELGIPAPLGFATLFICMGYMCLEPSVFIQYLCNDVFLPTKRFLQILFTECEYVDEAFLFEVIANLSYELQEIGLDLWKHPLLQQMMSRYSSTAASISGQK